MNQLPNAQQETSKPSYVNNMMASNAQKESSAAITGMSRSIDALSRFMMKSGETTNKTLSSIDDTLDNMAKHQKKQAEDNKKLISSVKNVVKGDPSIKKDHLKKKTDDDVAKLIKRLDQRLAKEFEDRKNQAKKKGFGILGALAGLLTVGGLMGYLVTGKTEFLFSTVKGLKTAGKLMMELFTMPLKIAKGAKGFTKLISDGEKVAAGLSSSSKMFKAFKGFFKGFKELNTIGGMGKAFASIGKGAKSGGDILKNIKNVIKTVKNFKDIGKAVAGGFKAVASLAKTGAKTAGKAVGKGMSKMFVKKIPVIGPLMGLAFGISRFTKGDVVGGLLEVASGLTSLLLPGIGIPLGLLIDGVLLMNDMKGGKMFAGANKAIKSTATGLGKSVANIKNIPIIGSIIRVQEAFKLWNSGDKMGAFKQFMEAGLVNIPGMGMLTGVLDYFWKTNGEKKLESGKGAGAKGDAYSIASSVGNFMKETINPSAAGDFLSSAGNKISSGASSAAKQVSSMAKSTAKTVGSGVKAIAQKAGNLIGYVLGRGVDVSGMNPKVWNNFLGMASEYKSLFGKSMPVNSAYRSLDKQAALYKAAISKYGSEAAARKWAAPPGKSMHNYGFAMDIGDRGGILKGELVSSGLAKKWGFDFPMSYEPWHIEPEGLKAKYADVRAGTYQADAPPITNPTEADAYNIKPGVLGSIGKAFNFGGSGSAPVVIKMMPEDINMLAAAFGKEYRSSIPKTGSAPVMGGAPVNARG